MGGSPSPPPVADPAGVSAGQFASSLAAGESAQAGSQVNQIGPTGSSTYYQTGVGPNGVPTYTNVQQLTPQQQQLLNEQQLGMGLAGGAGANLMANTFNQYSSPTNLTDAAGGATQQLLGQETSYLQPYFSQQTSQMDTSLRNQGIMPGTPAYNQQMLNLSQQQNNAVTGFLAQAEPAAFQQAQTNYLTPLQVSSALMGENQPGNVNLPETGQAPNYQAPDVIGAQANAQSALESNYQAQLQQQTAMLTGLMGLGSAGIKAASPASAITIASERHFKRDITRIGEKNGVPIYIWRYLHRDGWHVGPMLDEAPPWMTAFVNGQRMLRDDWDVWAS
jgi:hypothetical protein